MATLGSSPWTRSSYTIPHCQRSYHSNHQPLSGTTFYWDAGPPEAHTAEIHGSSLLDTHSHRQTDGQKQTEARAEHDTGCGQLPAWRSFHSRDWWAIGSCDAWSILNCWLILVSCSSVWRTSDHAHAYTHTHTVAQIISTHKHSCNYTLLESKEMHLVHTYTSVHAPGCNARMVRFGLV